MNLIETTGIVAASLTTLAWMPQAIRTIRTRDTAAISPVFQSMMALGILLWLVYGLMIGSMPLVIANIVTFIPVVAILVVKLREGRG
jgi:MtN3 and saliva related transmembrane protein